MSDYLGPYLLGPNDTLENGIYTGDARELAKAIPDESVDLIFCDPVYQNIDDYRWLAETAARVLRNGGNCIVQIAHEYMPLVLEAMMPALSWVWPLAERLDGANARIWGKRIFVAYKPWLWFSKNSRMGKWVRDLGQSAYSKRYHRWGDGTGFMFPYIRALCSRAEIVLDPFTGGGTVPAVCKRLGRKYLAFEIDPDVAEAARERVRMTQMPLFVLEAEQMTLGGG